jgi:hypothetical protein
MDWFSRFSASVAAGIFLNYLLVPLIMSTALGGMIVVAFGRLKKRKEQIAFGVGSFILFLTLIYALGSRSQEPILTASIQSVFIGDGATDRENIGAIALNVVNTGTMQTIVKNWRVSVEANGHTYDAAFPIMPESFTFRNIPSTTPNQPTSITLHSSDNLLEKSLTPIQVGALLPGVLFVAFQNVDKSLFKTGVTYTVTFEDVFSRVYSTQIKSNASIGNVGLVPGVKMDAVCPTPPGGLPKLGNDITSSIKPPASAVPATKPSISP